VLNRRRPAFFVRAALNRRAYAVLWKMGKIYPPVWSRAFWEPNFRLARDALRREAAQKIRELTQLIALLRGRELNVIVEIGTDRGGTLYAWCRLAQPDATIVSIDLPGAAFSRGPSDRVSLETSRRKAQTLHFVFGDSHDPATYDQVTEILGGRTVDFLMIDGDHTYDGVKRDFELYSALVRAGGLIALHDVLPNQLDHHCAVDRFWQEVRQKYRTTEFLDPYDDRCLGQWGGIGVVFWESAGTAENRPQRDQGVDQDDELGPGDRPSRASGAALRHEYKSER
jgi:cephalosporin hydroxylase